MALQYSKAPESLERELHAVSRESVALLDVLRSTNSLPRDFPQVQLSEIVQALRRLPRGTAEGSQPILLYASHRLAAIRREYLRIDEEASQEGDSNEHELPFRDTMLDQRLRELIASIAFAYNEYLRLAQPEIGYAFEPSETMHIQDDAAFRELVPQSELLTPELTNAIAEIDEIARPESRGVDDLKRQLTDALNLNHLIKDQSWLSTAGPSWLDSTSNALLVYPELIRATADSLRIGLDVSEPAFERWHAFKRNLFDLGIDQLQRLSSDFLAVARNLEQASTKQPSEIIRFRGLAVARVGATAGRTLVTLSSLLFLLFGFEKFLPSAFAATAMLIAPIIQALDRLAP